MTRKSKGCCLIAMLLLTGISTEIQAKTIELTNSNRINGQVILLDKTHLKIEKRSLGRIDNPQG